MKVMRLNQNSEVASYTIQNNLKNEGGEEILLLSR